MVARHSHSERHWGVHPLSQSPPWAAELANPNYADPNSAGGAALIDLADPTDPQDAATKAYVDGLSAARDLLTGDSQTFAAGIGDWTDNESTVTDETTDPWAFTGQHHAHVVLDGTSPFTGAFCPVAGTFATGVRYAALFVVKALGADNLVLNIGGTGDSGPLLTVAPPEDYLAYVLYWTPAADVSDTTISVTGEAGTAAFEIDVTWAAVVRADVIEDVLLALARIPSADPDDSQSPAFILRGDRIGMATGVGLRFEGQDLLKLRGRFGNAQVWINDDATGSVLVIAGAGGAGGDLSGEGVEIDVGPDGLSLFIGEEDSGTLQLWPGASNANLRDNGTNVWLIDGGPP